MSRSKGNTDTSRAIQRQKAALGLPTKEFLLGSNTSRIYQADPRLLLFTMARYKFVAKMFEGFDRVIEVGCQEGFGAAIVAKSVGHLHGLDFYEPFIESCRRRGAGGNSTFELHDILSGPPRGKYCGAFALDVLEHIDASKEQLFLRNITEVLARDGVLILGTPSIESQRYASRPSRIGHVNCKTGSELRALMCSYFENVFMFCMNDEVLHTGFMQMAHYLIAVGCGVRGRRRRG